MTLERFRIHHTLGWSLFGATAILLLGAIGVGAVTYDRAYRDRIIPGVRIGPVEVGGLTKPEATARVNAVVDAYLERGIPFTFQGKTVVLDTVVRAPQDSGFTYALLDVDVPTLVAQAFQYGRATSQAAAWEERARGLVGAPLAVPLEGTIAADRLARALTERYADALAPMEPPRLVPRADGDAVTWEVRAGRSGFRFARATIAAAVAVRLASLDPAPILLAAERVDPPYTVEGARAALPAFERALARAPLTLAHGSARWVIDRERLAGWFTLADGPTPRVDPAAVDAYLATIAGTIERAASDARFTLDPATKRVREFRPARAGIRIDRARLVAAMDAAAFGSAVPLIEVPIIEEHPAVELGATNDLGIRERLGVGTTSFRGSPPNRRHNIRVGTDLLNGFLIAPGETFSTVRAISPFTAATGYKPELVIKENRTVPEFGGGLCQVSTTLFRAVLAAGLPVVERTNHAYRVPYYEPPIGMDATIYGPKPDFTFTNDTGFHILLLARVEGDSLVYEFWGTADGRVATTTEPEVFNFTAPPPTKEIETDELKPGQRKCTERAHTGADAKFTYTVTYADGRAEERVFRSHYRPWQAVCLIGKKPEAPTLGPGQANSQKPEGDGDDIPLTTGAAPATPTLPAQPSPETTPLSGGN